MTDRRFIAIINENYDKEEHSYLHCTDDKARNAVETALYGFVQEKFQGAREYVQTLYTNWRQEIKEFDRDGDGILDATELRE